jgi:hypothetical protein
VRANGSICENSVEGSSAASASAEAAAVGVDAMGRTQLSELVYPYRAWNSVTTLPQSKIAELVTSEESKILFICQR